MITPMTELPDFFLRALLGSALLALVTGPLGCLLVWRRMAFFGDALAHAALLGVALGLMFELPIMAAVLGVGLLFALTLTLLARKPDLAHDTLLGILSPTALALGLIALHAMPGVKVDLLGYLFGDILALSGRQLVYMSAGVALVLACLLALWRPLMKLTVAPDLAKVSGLPTARLELIFLALLALVIAAGVQLVGVLLLTALLVIPAATARRMARTPEQMALLAAATSLLASVLGLFASLYYDVPAGPAMVASAAGLFILSRIVR